MLAEIERNKKRFGEENVKYVFVTEKNTPVNIRTINEEQQIFLELFLPYLFLFQCYE